MKSRISAKEAAYVARESLKRRAIRLLAPEGGEQPPGALVPSELSEDARQAPPRVLKPSPLNDQCVAPTPDLESHRKRLREAFGNTMSDEFVEVLLGKLLEALRPAALESLEEPMVNAALAIIDSMCPQSELEALLAVQIIAAGFSGLRLLRADRRAPVPSMPARKGDAGREPWFRTAPQCPQGSSLPPREQIEVEPLGNLLPRDCDRHAGRQTMVAKSVSSRRRPCRD
jgi:hypothetical protein